MVCPDKVLELVERFERNKQSYMSQSYNEAQVREEFINPFFEALGWDVRNVEGRAEAYKDVIHEDAIKIGKTTKAPDYSFRIGGQRKFFVETKKPAVNIKVDANPAYQIRRYSWSAKLSLAILTDFEEFAVYDCRKKPLVTDSASVERVLYIRYDEYEKKWDELEKIFSKQSILQGLFDQYAESTKGKKGTSEVDDEFLKEIERWRDSLARNIALRNEKYSVREINYAVQKTVDRIIFLRICEDRGIEPYEQLHEIAQKENIYKNLLKLFEKADEKYNSGIFYFKEEKGRTTFPDYICPNLKIDDNIFKDIIKNLYFPDCPYEFSVIGADILGNVYEQFLGKVIRLTEGHRAKVEEKPEVKKAGGVYYTPKYIVDYIVENTVGKLIDGKSPKQIESLKVLDPACGSGSFLIGAYHKLLEYHRDWYVSHDPIKHKDLIYQGQGGQWYLTLEEKKKILLNNIYGVDIDEQAVEVAKLNLLLKVLEGEHREAQKRLGGRILPDLDKNIKCGNSLISPDFYTCQTKIFTEEETLRINTFDWNKEFPFKFDAIIGNPPYGAELSPIEQEWLKKKYGIGSSDTAQLMMKLSYELMKDDGIHGFIIPKAFIFASNWNKIRELFLDNLEILVDCKKVWKQVKLEQIIYIIHKGKKFSHYFCNTRIKNSIESRGQIDKKYCKLFEFILNDITERELQLGLKIKDIKTTLNDMGVNQRGDIFQKYITPVGKFPVLAGANIQKYETRGIKGYIQEDIKFEEKAKIKPNSILAQRIVAHIENPKDHIKITASIEQGDYLIVDTLNQITVNKGISNKFILTLLNSKLISWYSYRFIFAKAIRTMQFDNPTTSRIPMPLLNSKEQEKFIQKCNSMLELHKRLSQVKTPQEKSVLERQIEATDNEINQLVYKLYGLSDDEIKIVEGR
jgi:type I restriction-modification system DNA methylase subunit